MPLWCAKVRNRLGLDVAIGGRGRVFLALRATGEKKVICRLLVEVDGGRVGIQERRERREKGSWRPCVYAFV